ACGTPPRLVMPAVARGSRWHWPAKSLLMQLRIAALRRRPATIVAVGINYLTTLLLRTTLADKALVWELTDAHAGNKFVNVAGIRLLHRSRAVMSPSAAVDANIRAVYSYRGCIIRVPFWVRDNDEPYAPMPSQFDTDFLFLGRRDREKGLSELVRAIAEVVYAWPDVRVHVGGIGNADEFVSLADSLGVRRQITFGTFETNSDALAALEKSRALILPSYHEGYPLVLLEACKKSVPFIATAVGSVPEMLGDSLAGILVAPRDTSALARAMLSFRSDSAAQYERRRRAAFALFQRCSSRVRIREITADLLAAAM
ncbi:MAG TPA: glycosyltransferase, partial [Chthoniobacterales bacterium]|nr:glycosyltransferase [Chthoniobacterales bacterium]